MTRPLRKPLWRWEPAPYLLLILLLLITGSIRPERLPVVYWILFAITAVVAAVLIVLLVVQLVRGRRNPDAAGMLTSLDGIQLVRLGTSDAPRTPVADTARHQAALDSAQARAGRAPVVVLVPDATRWLALRIRIAVHVVVPDRIYHVGFLPDQATIRYNAGLRALAARGRYVAAPATVIGSSRPYKLELDLGALTDVIDAAHESLPN
ncbi:hypothetical protein ACX9R5_14475 [Rathayibacter sp. CAU 1779]